MATSRSAVASGHHGVVKIPCSMHIPLNSGKAGAGGPGPPRMGDAGGQHGFAAFSDRLHVQVLLTCRIYLAFRAVIGERSLGISEANSHPREGGRQRWPLHHASRERRVWCDPASLTSAGVGTSPSLQGRAIRCAEGCPAHHRVGIKFKPHRTGQPCFELPSSAVVISSRHLMRRTAWPRSRGPATPVRSLKRHACHRSPTFHLGGWWPGATGTVAQDVSGR